MRSISNRRAIVNRQAAQAALEAIVADAALRPDDRRAAILAQVKALLAAGQAEIRARFEAEGDGARVVAGTAFLMDQILRLLYDAALRAYPTANPTTGEQLSMVALGGYGRGELAPDSDIDLLFLRAYKSNPHTEQVVEYVLYMLWDLGLKVGHATRTADECLRLARGDITIRTALLESRWLWGDQALYEVMRQRFRAELQAGTGRAFLEAKLAERDERHRRMGDSRYVLEPNVKDGKGGLRDLHTLFWIGKYVYQVDDMGGLVEHGVLTVGEARRFAKAQAFLWTVRCHLHYLAGRAEERLTFDLQPEIGARMGYADRPGASGVERFMKHYFHIAKQVGDLTRIFCAALEEDQARPPLFSLERLGFRTRNLDGFRLQGGRLTVADEDAFQRDPVDILRIFHVAQRTGLDIHPHALRRITQDLKRVDTIREDPEANRLFLEMLTAREGPEITLRRMNEAGVFGRFVPDFGRVVAQMQYDMYHVYTVDEHTIFALGILHRIETGLLREELPLATEVIHRIASRRSLYVAVFLHDIAKGRGGDHSELGAEVALALGPRLGLTDEETETVAWLVRHHLLLSHTAFKRDLADPKTVADLIAVVQSPERLRLLLVLTAADIRAVGPRVWNGWKAALLRDIYHAGVAALSGGLSADWRHAGAQQAQAALAAELADWPEAEVAAHVARGTPPYWLAFDTAHHLRHARLLREVAVTGAPLLVDTRVDRGRAVTEVTICTADHAGLFARIAGALAVAGASIVDARIYTLADGLALDTFWVQDAEGGAFDRPDRLARLSVLVERALSGRLDPEQELAAKRSAWPTRTAVFTVPPRVIVDNSASNTHTVLEVNARDRPGLLYDVTRVISGLNLQIASARIATYGERAVDVFYVKDVFGMKVDHAARITRIRDEILVALGGVPGEPAPAPARTPRRRPAGSAKTVAG